MHERYAEDLKGFRGVFAATHRRLDEIEAMPAGLTRMAAVQQLRCATVDSAAAVRIVVLDAGNQAWFDAQKMISTNDAVDGHGYPLGATICDRIEMTGHEFAAALRISYPTANNDIAFHRYVAERLPAAWVALSHGELSTCHVKAIYGATEHCAAHVTEAVDAAIVPLTIERRWTPAQIRRHARTIIISIDPDGAAERAKKATTNDTNVEFYPDNDDMATVRAHGDAATGREVFDTINARAAQMGRDPLDHRSVGQRRFDAMAEFVLGVRGTATLDPTHDGSGNPKRRGATDGATAAQQRARSHGEALIHLDLNTALGLNDNPGYLDGYGPITADLARTLAKDATWRRFLTDPITSQLLDLGRSTYQPTAALRAFIEAKHPTCTMIGCQRPARHCQIDHKHEWERHGCTDCTNLHPLCLMHHQQKTKKHWTLNQTPDGDTWTSTLGFTYRRDDRPYNIPPLDPPDPDYFEYLPDPPTTSDLAPPPYPDEPIPPEARYTDEPPLDPYETEELTDALDNSWGEFATRAYNLLRAAQLIE